MAKRAAKAALEELAAIRATYGDDAAARKCGLLDELATARLGTADRVLRLHEILCFLRAWPDDAEVFARVDAMLDTFDERADLKRHREALESTGIAGTATCFRFYSETALWLARRWGAQLEIAWEEVADPERLQTWLPVLATWTESPGLDEVADDARAWIDRLKGPGETDAAFLLRRLPQIKLDPVLRGLLLDELDLPLELAPGPDTPARTRERWPVKRVAWQTGPLAGPRPTMPAAMRKPPKRIRSLPLAEGRRMVRLARAAMVVRSRDLDAFMYADPHDVRIAELEEGHQIAFLGMVPSRRLLFEVQYGYLVLENGVPVGYGTVTSLFGSGEVAYTIFDTFRGAQAAEIFVLILRAAHHLFGIDAFMIDPYQIGQANEDAVQSGAWWFYRKLGFAPLDRQARALMRREENAMRKNRAHRSSAATLRRLAEAPVFLFARREREDVLGLLPLPEIGLKATAYLASRFGYDRRGAERRSAQEAAVLLGAGTLSGIPPARRLAWERWGPIVLMLPGVERWPPADRRALAAVIRAKGARRESEYLKRFDAHKRLRRALRELAETT